MLSALKIVLVGTEARLMGLEAGTISVVAAMLRSPCQPIEVAEVLERIRPDEPEEDEKEW